MILLLGALAGQFQLLHDPLDPFMIYLKTTIQEFPVHSSYTISSFVFMKYGCDFRNYIRKASGRESFDLVFIDPPYEMKCCAEAAALLAKAELVIPGALVVLESGEEEIDLTSDKRLAGYELVRQAQYGKKTAVTVLVYRGEES